MPALWFLRLRHTGVPFVGLLLISVLSFTPEAFAATPRFNQPVGEVRGTSPAQVAFDGKTWTPLRSATMPVFHGTLVRALRGGQSRTILAQSSGVAPLRPYAEAHQAFAILLPPTGLPAKLADAGLVWAYNASNPQDVSGGWEPVRIGTPPAFPSRPDQELRRGFAWAWEVPTARWTIVRRDCQGVPAFLLRAGATPTGAVLPPPTDPPSKVAGVGQMWAWNALNPPDVFGGWASAKLSTDPVSPLRPDQELKDGYVWAWNQQQSRWDVVEECDLAAAFLVPAGAGVIPFLGAGAGVGAVSAGAALLTSGGGSDTPTASNASL